MVFYRNYSSVKDQKGGGAKNDVPKGKYPVEIERTQETDRDGNQLLTKSGVPLVRMRLRVLSGEQEGKHIYDKVYIFEPDAKGAGYTKRFLSAINQPISGEVDPKKWPGEKLIVTMGLDAKQEMNVLFRDPLPKGDMPGDAQE